VRKGRAQPLLENPGAPHKAVEQEASAALQGISVTHMMGTHSSFS